MICWPSWRSGALQFASRQQPAEFPLCIQQLSSFIFNLFTNLLFWIQQAASPSSSDLPALRRSKRERERARDLSKPPNYSTTTATLSASTPSHHAPFNRPNPADSAVNAGRTIRPRRLTNSTIRFRSLVPPVIHPTSADHGFLNGQSIARLLHR